MFKKINRFHVINLITVLFFILLPYYLFNGKLYVGGDDTRLLYSYPFEYLKNSAFFSWYNVSSVGMNVPSQYLIPFLSVWSLLGLLIGNRIILSYFAFSLPLILGFLYFKKFVKELFSLDDKYAFELFIGSLCFILSPILIINQLFIFLTTVWLLGVIPALLYYFIRYMRTSKFVYVYISLLISFVFAFAVMSIPWIFGLLVPMILGSFVLVLLSTRREIFYFLKRSVIFIVFIMLPQAFWLLGFIATFIVQDKNSLAVKFLSRGFLNTFTPSVDGASHGYINYPLLNLFHRRIAFDFEWKLKSEFISLYDKTVFLDLLFIFIIAVGLFYYRKYLNKQHRKIYLFILTSLILSLYFFTVNIGPLRDLFMLFRYIPGFVMFRNFYDKFAPGYVFLYSILITVSLVIIKNKYPKKHNIINFFFLLLILLNFSSVKSTVNSPLWTTENVYKTMNIPDEYLNLMDQIKENVPSTNNILTVPYGDASYSVIKDSNSDHVYVGISPVKIFSGVNDISGGESFSLTENVGSLDDLIINRDYKKLNALLFKHNINYVLITKNIPHQVLGSYVFGKLSLAKQDSRFIGAIEGKKILTSDNGNYELFVTKKSNIILDSKNLFFKKINSVRYTMYIKGIKSKQDLKFNDTFHDGWFLYLKKNPNLDCTQITSIIGSHECKSEFKFFDLSEMSYLWSKPIFGQSHTTIDGSSNIWEIDPGYIKKNYTSDYYKENKDGSLDVELVMYFKPQLYFYYGLIISFTVIILSTVYLINGLLKKNEKKDKKS